MGGTRVSPPTAEDQKEKHKCAGLQKPRCLDLRGLISGEVAADLRADEAGGVAMAEGKEGLSEAKEEAHGGDKKSQTGTQNTP